MGQPLPPAPPAGPPAASQAAPQPPVYPPPPPVGASGAPGAPGAPGHPPQPGSMAPMAPIAPEPSASTAPTLAMRRPAPLTTLPPESPRPRNRVWAAIKWPLRKLLLGIYILVAAIRRHTREALVIGGLLLALIVAGVVVYAVTRPAPPPVTVEQSSPPALAPSVIQYLHASQHFDGAEMWTTLDPSARKQLKVTETQLQASLNQEKAAGLTINRYVYSGGYHAPDGTSHYVIEVYASEQGQSGAFTWYFTVGTNGLITQRLDLTQ